MSFLGQRNFFNVQWHCVKSVRIRSYSGSYFPAFGLITERYTVSFRNQSERSKVRTRLIPNTDTFYAVLPMVSLQIYGIYQNNKSVRTPDIRHIRETF